MKKKNTQQGYSILELLIYIGMVAMLSIILIQSLVTVMRTYATAQGYRRLQSNGELIMERLTREIRNATSVTSGTYGTNPGAISLSGTDGAGAARTVDFSVANSAVQLSENGATASAISTSEVTATSLIFRSISTPAGSGVKIELKLTTANGYIVSAPFYATVMLRGE